MKSCLSIALLALVVSIPAGPVFAQAFPTKPIRVMVTVPPGGVADVVARLVAPKTGDALGQPLLIENSAGLFGIIAAARVARSPADGHMLMITTPSSQILARFTSKFTGPSA